MKFKLKRKAPLPETERQMVLGLLASLYVDVEQPQKKPPTTDPGPASAKLIALTRKATA